jgi:hypothetical protein
MNKLRQCLHRRLLTRDVLLHVDTGTDFERVAEGAQVPALRKLPLALLWNSDAGEIGYFPQ